MADNKPTYDRSGCPACKKFKPGCTNCGKEIPAYENIPAGVGFQSNSVDHYHFMVLGDKNGMAIVMGKFCRECYLEDFNANPKNTPKRTLKDLPREVVYK